MKFETQLRLRVVTTDSDECPYQLESKGGWWPFWKKISTHGSLDNATFYMKHYKPPVKPGTIVAEYTPEDRVVEKLRGHQ